MYIYTYISRIHTPYRTQDTSVLQNRLAFLFFLLLPSAGTGVCRPRTRRLSRGPFLPATTRAFGFVYALRIKMSKNIKNNKALHSTSVWNVSVPVRPPR
ncbi:hypothetical protein IscW_ISCW003011 [Ixodes scapularis]|uniref:Uncharacterized protein n=1 Tax=Ixodes scapularis TaxID=6945 RepID=B7P961_IXOSC|nr:hypothetical protein IscW_ISCW003011 [Ixodes scapularis]|eukprot:XP_002403684.1 hypothetical protein IscW_ISCW003011 [Ixodes scapularis]